MIIRNLIKLSAVALSCSVAAGAAWADGAVYAMTNTLGNNQVLVYHRAADGNLTLAQTIPTGGGGSGLQLAGVDSLGSAGSIQLDPDHSLLFVVNTESAAENNGHGAYNTDCQQGTITSFRVASDGTLTVADRISSGGLFPNSLTVKRVKASNDGRGRGDEKSKDSDLLYVLNAGGPEVPVCNLHPHIVNRPNITGFTVDSSGHMEQVQPAREVDPGPSTSAGPGENCPATGFAAAFGFPEADLQCGLNPPSFPRSPAQVRFTPDGNRLVVTVKGTSTIYVFPVGENGRAGSPTTTQASLPALPGPFGVTFDKNGHLLVTELFGTATAIPAGGKGAVSSYTIAQDGNLIPISRSVSDGGGTAACWIALEPITGNYAYVANNLGGNGIASFRVANDGSVTLLNGTAASPAPSGPNDLAVASEGGASFLYAVAAGSGSVAAFQIDPATGSLTAITGGGGLPAGRSAQGLAAF
jgi:6-phosphogluconolactonase